MSHWTSQSAPNSWPKITSSRLAKIGGAPNGMTSNMISASMITSVANAKIICNVIGIRSFLYSC